MSNRKSNFKKVKNIKKDPVEQVWDKLFPTGIPKNFNKYNKNKFINLKEIADNLPILKHVGGAAVGMGVLPPDFFSNLATFNYALHLYYQIDPNQLIPLNMVDVAKINAYTVARGYGIGLRTTFRNYIRASANSLRIWANAHHAVSNPSGFHGIVGPIANFIARQEHFFKLLERQQLWGNILRHPLPRIAYRDPGPVLVRKPAFQNLLNWAGPYLGGPMPGSPYTNYTNYLAPHVINLQNEIDQIYNDLTATRLSRTTSQNAQTAMNGIINGLPRTSRPMFAGLVANMTVAVVAANTAATNALHEITNLDNLLDDSAVSIDGGHQIDGGTPGANLGTIAGAQVIQAQTAAEVIAGAAAAGAGPAGAAGIQAAVVALAATIVPRGLRTMQRIQQRINSVLGSFRGGPRLNLNELQIIQTRLNAAINSLIGGPTMVGGNIAGLQTLQQLLNGIVYSFRVTMATLANLQRIQARINAAVNGLLAGHAVVGGNMAGLQTLQQLLNGIVNLFAVRGSSMNVLQNIQAQMNTILAAFLRPTTVTGVELDELQRIQLEMQTIIWLLQGRTLNEIRNMLSGPGATNYAVAAATAVGRQASRLYSRVSTIDYSKHGKAGELIKAMDVYSYQMDELYAYLEEYESTKQNFLEVIASASSYLVRLLLMGSDAEYKNAFKGLSAAPESMVHSFSTVLEREAPIDEDHLPSDIVSKIDPNIKGKKTRNIKKTLRNPIDSETDDENNTNDENNTDNETATTSSTAPSSSSRGGGTLQVFSWNVYYKQKASVAVQKKIIKKQLNNADILAFQELTDEMIGRIGLDFSNYTEYKTQSGPAGKEDQMHTYIKKRLTPKLEGHGEFQSGRPFLINSFTLSGKKVLFINVHLGHRLHGVVPTIDPTDLAELQKVVKAFDFDRLIMAGDFNNSPKEITLKNKAGNFIKAKNIKPESERRSLYTCCNKFKDGGAPKKAGFIDNILDSYYKSTNNAYSMKVLVNQSNATNPTNDIGSDHSPILATLPISISTAGGGVIFVNEYMSYNKPAWEKIGHEFVEQYNKRRRTKGGRR